MDEQILFDRVHQALDVEVPAGAYEQLRKTLASRSVDRSQGKSPLGRAAWPRPAMQLAAAVLVVVLAAAAVVTFVQLRTTAPRSAPAVSIEAYKTMLNRDVSRLDSAGNGVSCTTLQSTCPQPGKPVLKAYQRWLDDLNGSEPPAKFAVIDAQMRKHLAAAISDINTVYAAYAARNQDGLDRAGNETQRQGDWLNVVASTIVNSRQGTAAGYADSVLAARRQGLDVCPECQLLSSSGPIDCTGSQESNCEGDVAYAKSAIEDLEAAVMRVAAPGSLAAQDALLQRDLAEADTAVLAMATALLTGDQGGFSAGRLLFQHAFPAVNAEVAGILGG
jgi:hypothetical protein